MTSVKAIFNSNINAFDIITLSGGKFDVYTHRHKNESKEAFIERDYRNLMWACRFKKRQQENRGK